MNKINLIQPEKVILKDHPILTESWLQDIIAKNPELIGLGDFLNCLLMKMFLDFFQLRQSEE